jgi:hypothetical protein
MSDSQPPWEHPAIAGKHLYWKTTKFSDDGVKLCIATCLCGWRLGVKVADAAQLDHEIARHRDAVIAAAVVDRQARGR